jgi:hypothetical protein
MVESDCSGNGEDGSGEAMSCAYLAVFPFIRLFRSVPASLKQLKRLKHHAGCIGSFEIDREVAVTDSCPYTIRCRLDDMPLGHRILRKP